MLDETQYYTIAGQIISVVGILLIACGVYHISRKEDDEANSGSR